MSGARRYDLVIFDFDGTLADSAPWFRTVFNDIAQRFGFRQLSAAELEALRGQSTRDIIRSLNIPAWKMPLLAAHMRRRIGRDAHLIRPFPGADVMLAALAAEGARLAIVSSNAETNVRRILGAETAARIDLYGCGVAMLGKGAMFRTILKRARMAAGRALSIGDEVRDIEAARQVGIASGAVLWGYASGDILRLQAPAHVFASMDEIVACVRG